VFPWQRLGPTLKGNSPTQALLNGLLIKTVMCASVRLVSARPPTVLNRAVQANAPLVRRRGISHSIKVKGKHLAVYRATTPKFNPFVPKGKCLRV